MKLRFLMLATIAAIASGAPAGAVTLYSQNFESPVGFVNNGGDINLNRTVNQLYGNQPVGFLFGQRFTSETLMIGGTEAFGTGYSDPSGIGGRYVIAQQGGVGSSQQDLLGLAFNLGASTFLNFRLNISGIDLDRFAAPFVAPGGAAPTFRFSLFDNPSGAAGFTGATLLDSFDASAPFNPSKSSFLWSTVNQGLDASGSTNGNVLFQINILSGGYAAFDNITITADNIGGGVPGVPEPGVWAMLIAGFGLVGASMRNRRKAIAA